MSRVASVARLFIYCVTMLCVAPACGPAAFGQAAPPGRSEKEQQALAELRQDLSAHLEDVVKALAAAEGEVKDAELRKRVKAALAEDRATLAALKKDPKSFDPFAVYDALPPEQAARGRDEWEDQFGIRQIEEQMALDGVGDGDKALEEYLDLREDRVEFQSNDPPAMPPVEPAKPGSIGTLPALKIASVDAKANAVVGTPSPPDGEEWPQVRVEGVSVENVAPGKLISYSGDFQVKDPKRPAGSGKTIPLLVPYKWPAKKDTRKP